MMSRRILFWRSILMFIALSAPLASSESVSGQGILTVMPAGGFHSEGLPGQPFNPPGQTYSVQNTGGGSIDWTAAMASGQNAFILSKTSGTLLPWQVDVVTVTVNADYPFTPGIDYPDTIQFNNVTNTQGNTGRAVDAIVIDTNQGILAVLPAGGFHSEGLPGQPFNPPGQPYSVQNTGGGSIDWTAAMASGQNAFILSKTSGTLLPWQVDVVTVTVNADYPFTPGIDYPDTLQFNNVTNTQGNTGRAVDAIVIDTNQAILMVDFDGDGKTDITVYRTNTGAWYVHPSGGGSPYGFGWGGDPTDKPVPGDYDGDRKTDYAVYRTGTGAWYVYPSGGGSPYGFGWGGDPTDKPASGDYDGDGKTDAAIYRASTGGWYIIPSSTPGAPYGIGWGGDPSDNPAITNPGASM